MKMLRYLIGPELIWLLAIVSMKYFGQYNIRTQGQYNNGLEKMAYILPILLIIACMTIYKINIVPKQLLLLRLIIASIVGSHFIFSYCAAAHTVGGPGAGMIYILGLCFTVMCLIVSCVIKIFILVTK